MEHHVISGYANPGFEEVRDAFADNFERRGELGAACCVYHCGEKVVDLWGGIRDKATGEPWEEDTMVIVFSATKGVAALTMALAHSRGLFDYDERVGTYWPEFRQGGKEDITVRQLLAHQAGLFVLDEPLDAVLLSNLDRLAAVLARQKPAWEPGTCQGYHAVSIGFYEGELLRRVDPEHRSIGRYFQDEIAKPLELDFYIRVPEEIPDSRLAPMYRPRAERMMLTLFTMPPSLALAGMNSRSNLRRALLGSELPETEARGRVYARNLEVPAGGGVGTARSLARVYSEFATGGKELGLREETLGELAAPAVLPTLRSRDECLRVEAHYGLGFSKPGPGYAFGHPSSYGAPGSGGSFGYADPHYRIGFGYVPNQMGTHLDDPRADALRKATYRSIGESDPYNAEG